jgi:hypothetical protein
MNACDQLPVSDLAARRRGGRETHGDLSEAERLISDLAALVDAGLIVVKKQLGGAARYAVAPDLGDAA